MPVVAQPKPKSSRTASPKATAPRKVAAAPTGGASGSATGDASDGASATDVFHARLVGYFAQVKPGQIEKVPHLLERFTGREAKLEASLVKRFGGSLPPLGDVLLRERLVAFFQKVKPSAVAKVDGLMAKIPNEAKLRAKLHSKFGSAVV